MEQSAQPLLPVATQDDQSSISTTSYGIQEDRLSSAGTNIVIIGGGPTGLFTALMLYKCGIRNITIIERLSNETVHEIDVQKSYIFGLTIRGKLAVNRMEGLMSKLREATPTPDEYMFSNIDINGNVNTIHPKKSFGASVKNYTPAMLLYRPRFIQTLRTFIEETCEPDSIRILDKCAMKNTQFNQDGSCDIHFYNRHNECENVIRSKFVLACDGSNSSFVKTLQKQEQLNNPIIHSKHGFQYKKFKSPFEGSYSRCIKFEIGSIHKSFPDKIPQDHTLCQWIFLKGKKFWAYVNPMLQEDTEKINGYPAILNLPSTDELWKTRDIEKGYEIFESNFPQFNIRECISEKSMNDFLQSKSQVIIPALKYVRSLGGSIGGNHEGGIIILGDAAHSMAPEMGQGLNSSLDDVSTLYDIISQNGGSNALINDVVTKYQNERLFHVDGLCHIVCTGGMMSKRSKIDGLFRSVSSSSRKYLSRIAPSLFYPQAQIMVVEGRPYGVAWKKHNQTTVLLIIMYMILLILLVGIIVFIVCLLV